MTHRITSWNTPYTFSGKEKDVETGYSYFGARYYDSDLSLWLSVDPMSDKYPNMSPYNYCANNPVILVDPDGREWQDIEGNKISDHSNIKVYIFYDPKDFKGQAEAMYKEAEAKYGKGSVAMSNVNTEAEFKKDWGDMGGKNIKEVNLNYHGGKQALSLNWKTQDYITSTGDGFTQEGNRATNVSDLPTPKGNISGAQLNINSCRSFSHADIQKGLSLGDSFFKYFNFASVRGTYGSVNYNTKGQPTTQWYLHHNWAYLFRNKPNPNSSKNNDFIRIGGCY